MNGPERVTSRRFEGLGEAKKFGALADVAAGPAEFRFIFEDDFVFAVKPRLEFMDEIEADESGAIDTDEEFGVERVLKIFKRAAERVVLRAAMQENVVAVGLNPRDFGNCNEVGAGIGFDEDAIGKGILLLQGLEHFGEARGEMLGGTRMNFADAAQDLFEAVFREGF